MSSLLYQVMYQYKFTEEEVRNREKVNFADAYKCTWVVFTNISVNRHTFLKLQQKNYMQFFSFTLKFAEDDITCFKFEIFTKKNFPPEFTVKIYLAV